MSYIVYVSDANSSKKIEPLGIYPDISKARECLHSSYTERYLSGENAKDHEIRVIGEDDIAVYKIDRGYFISSELPCSFYRIVKCSLSSNAEYTTQPQPQQQISTRPIQLQGLQINPEELKAKLGALKSPSERKPPDEDVEPEDDKNPDKTEDVETKDDKNPDKTEDEEIEDVD